MMSEWTNQAAIRLIDEYRQRPELWDTSHEMYRVQTAKYESWSELARMFECDITDLRKKLNSIFASHRREKAKVRAGNRSHWYLYDNMSFLPGHLDNDDTNATPINTNTKPVKTKTQSTSEESSQSSEEEEEEEDNGDNDEVVIKQEPNVPNKVRDRSRGVKRAKITNPLLQKRLLKRRIVQSGNTNTTNSSLDGKLLEALKLLRKANLSKKKDECDSFGEYIAISLRKHDERTQSMIKQAINNILFEQEMKKYSTGQYTVVISGMDENPLIIGDDK